MSNLIKVMGLVQNGRLRLFVPSGRPEPYARLTRNSAAAGEPPEMGEINLKEFEGSAIMITGSDQGDWIYEAEIVDHAGPILSAVVELLTGIPQFSQGSREG